MTTPIFRILVVLVPRLFFCIIYLRVEVLFEKGSFAVMVDETDIRISSVHVTLEARHKLDNTLAVYLSLFTKPARFRGVGWSLAGLSGTLPPVGTFVYLKGSGWG